MLRFLIWFYSLFPSQSKYERFDFICEICDRKSYRACRKGDMTYGRVCLYCRFQGLNEGPESG